MHGGVELFVFCRDKKGLFAIVTRILCSKNADIVEAEIMNTTDGWALDTFVLREDEGDQYIQNRAPSIISSVEKGLTDPNFKMPGTWNSAFQRSSPSLSASMRTRPAFRSRRLTVRGCSRPSPMPSRSSA